MATLGYKHSLTGTEYYHCSVQTRPEQPPVYLSRSHRDCQTVHPVSRSSQSKREQGTQMARPDLYIFPGLFERCVTSRPSQYETSEDLAARVLKAVGTIQCQVRAMFARRRMQLFRAESVARKQAEDKQRENQIRELEESNRFELSRRLNPQTHDDIILLKKEVEEFVQSSQVSTRQRNALLLAVSKLAKQVNDKHKEFLIDSHLSQLTYPKLWTQPGSGTLTEVITPEITRNFERIAIYRNLQKPCFDRENRLKHLEEVKSTVKDWSCELTEEISRLTDRETDLIQRNRPLHSMAVLRKRTKNLFLRFLLGEKFKNM